MFSLNHGMKVKAIYMRALQTGSCLIATHVAAADIRCCIRLDQIDWAKEIVKINIHTYKEWTTPNYTPLGYKILR